MTDKWPYESVGATELDRLPDDAKSLPFTPES